MIYNQTKEVVANGTSDPNKPSITKPSDVLKSILHHEVIDIEGAGMQKIVGKTTEGKFSKFTPDANFKNPDGERKNLEILKVLNKVNFFELNKNTTKSTIAMHGFTFAQQKSKQMSTIDGMVNAWKNLDIMKTKKRGKLFTFDLETFGGDSRDRRWMPAGITEFGMSVRNFATGQTKTTNIMMTNRENIDALEEIVKRYQTVFANGGYDAIKEDSELYVTGMRLSLYSKKRGAKFKQNEKGYFEATKIMDSKDHMAGNIDAVLDGFETIKDMASKETIDKTTGLEASSMEYIKAIGEMQTTTAKRAGIISGHNIIEFDRPITDMGVRKIYDTQLKILNNPNSTSEEKKKAEAAVNYIHDSFKFGNTYRNEYIGLSFRKGWVLDTLPIARVSTSEFGVPATYGGNKKALFLPGLDEFGSKAASQEALASILYPDLYKQGVSHLASFDALLNQHMILETSDKLDGLSFVDHIMKKAGGKGILGLYEKEGNVVELNSNQIFKAINTSGSASFLGKNYLNFLQYENGEIFTNGGYHIRPDGSIQYSKYTGNTGFNMNTFYSLDSQRKVKISDLDKTVQKKLRETYPELNAEHLYMASFKTHHTYLNSLDHTVNLVATSQDALEGIISSSLAHVATYNEQTEDYDLVQKNIGHLKYGAFNPKTGKVYSQRLRGNTGKAKLKEAISFYDNIALNDKTRNALNGSRGIKKISDILKFHEALENSDIKDDVYKILDRGIPLGDLIVSGETDLIDGEKYNKLEEMFINTIGYTYNGKKGLDVRTRQTSAHAYKHVVERKEYYRKLLDTVQAKYGYEDFDEFWASNSGSPIRDEVNEFFQKLNRVTKVNLAKKHAKPGQNVMDIANEVRPVSLASMEEFRNRYDFALGPNFLQVGEKPLTVKSLYNSNTDRDIVSFNIKKGRDSVGFGNKLYNLRMRDKKRANATQRTTEGQKRQAIYDFYMDLWDNRKDHKELFKYQELKTLIKDMKEYPRTEGGIPGFDVENALSVLADAVKYAKQLNPAAGIVKQMGSRLDYDFSRKSFIETLNNVTLDEINESMSGMRTTLYWETEAQRKNIAHVITKDFSITEKLIEEKAGYLGEDRVKILKLIKQDIDKKLETRIDDILTTCHMFNFDPYYDGKNFVISKNGQTAAVIDSLLRLNIDEDGGMYAMSGNSKLALNLRLAVTGEGKDRRIALTTNLDEKFGMPKAFENMFKGRALRGEELLETDFNKYIKFWKADLRESSMYEGTKYNTIYMNSKIDVSEPVDKLYYDLFAKDGELTHLIKDKKFNNSNLIPYMQKNAKNMKNDELPADLYMYGISDLINVLGSLYDKDSPYANNLNFIFSIINTGNKDTELSKKHLTLGDRVISNQSNKKDNVNRPVMYGASNVKLLQSKRVEEVGKDMFVLNHSIVESEKTLRLIHTESEAGALTSDVTYRELFAAGSMLQEQMLLNKKNILKNRLNINNSTIQQMNDKAFANVYDYLTEMISSSTHEHARLMDARLFRGLIDMPMDTQYMSKNLDLYKVANDDSDQKGIQRLIDLMGTIDVDDKGKVSYKRSYGTIVKKGEPLAEYSSYGGVTGTFGTKMSKGNMMFSIRDKNDIELSEEKISEILNKPQYVERFKNLSEPERINKAIEILEAENLKVSFKVESVGSSAFPKFVTSGGEKGMSLVPQPAVGQMNLANKEFFTELKNYAEAMEMDAEKYNFAERNILTKNAIYSSINDIAKKAGVDFETAFKSIDNGRFNTVENLIKEVLDEQYSYSEALFGQYGTFHGASSVVNDAIAKHNNTGLSAYGRLAEAITMYGKALDENHRFTVEGYNKALNEVVQLMNKDSSLNMFGETHKGGSVIENKKTLSIKNGTIIVPDAKEGEFDYLDNDSLENLIKKVDTLIVNQYGGQDKVKEEDRLVHENVMILNNKNQYEKGTYYGSALFREENGEKYVAGSFSTVNNSLMRDGETVSGVSQRYIDLNVAVKKLEAKTNLTQKEIEELQAMRNEIAATKASVKFMKLDDQALAILEQRAFNEETEKELTAFLRDKNSGFTETQANLLVRSSGGLISLDKDKNFIIDSSIKSENNINEIWLKKLKDERYYSEFNGKELTKEMLEEYPHLKEVYDDIVVGGRAPKIGLKEAQDIYDLRRGYAAALFNNTDNFMSAEEMHDKYDFKIMSIKDYISAEGSAHSETMDSVLNKHIIIDMGEEFGNDRYVAVPGMGRRVGDQEVRRVWQTKLDELKRDNDLLENMDGGGILLRPDVEGSYKYVGPKEWNNMNDLERQEAIKQVAGSLSDPGLNTRREQAIQYRMDTMARMKETATKIGELTNNLNKKDTLFTDYSKITVREAQSRMKMASITGDLFRKEFFDGTHLEGIEIAKDTNTFMNTAKVLLGDGDVVSLNELEEKGAFLDFKRVGRDYFEKAGYFDEKTKKAFGFTTDEEMAQYLKTRGTMTTDTRYPQIKLDSVFHTRTYLDEDYNDKNIMSVSATAMNKLKGDTDGDSGSFFETRVDNASFALYEKKKEEAMKAVREKHKDRELTDLDFMKLVREEATNNEYLTEDAYDFFTAASVEMMRTATIENKEYVDAVKKMNIKDVKSSMFTGASIIKYDNNTPSEKTIFQIKDAVSKTFSSKKFDALDLEVPSEEIEKNVEDLNKYVTQAFKANPSVFKGGALREAEKIAEGKQSVNRVGGNEKYQVLDQALSFFEQDTAFQGEEKQELLNEIQSAFIKRVRINQNFEEKAAKATKGAIAPVNSALYAIKIAAKRTFGNAAASDFYDTVKANLISRAAYELEEGPISGKKVAYEVGDERLLQLEALLNRLRKDGSTVGDREEMAEWFNVYVDDSVTENMWLAFTPRKKFTTNMKNRLSNTVKSLKEQYSGDIAEFSEDEWQRRAKNSIISDEIITSIDKIVSSGRGKSLIDATASMNRRGSTITAMAAAGVIDESTLGGEAANVIAGVSKQEAERRTMTEMAAQTQRVVEDNREELEELLFRQLEEKTTKSSLSGSLGLATLGVAASLLVAGYSGGHNSSRPTPPVDDTAPPPQSVPEFFDQQPSTVTPMVGQQQGYVINIKADTKKGERHMKRAMKEAVRATQASGSVNVNMNYRTTRSGGYSNKDIENIINNYI